MSKNVRLTLDDWSGGDYGRAWPGQKLPNTFRAVNVIPYPDGSIGPRAPLVEFTMPTGDSTLEFDGAASYVHAPLTSGWFDFTLTVAATPADYTPAADQVLAGQWVEAGDLRVFRLVLQTDGFLRLDGSLDGTAAGIVSSTSTVIASVSAVGYRVSRDTLGSVIFEETVDGSIYTAVGATIAGSAGDLFAVDGVLEIGTSELGTAGQFEGTVRSAAFLNAVAPTSGSTLAGPNFFAEAPGTTSFFDGVVPWTISGDAAIVSASGFTYTFQNRAIWFINNELVLTDDGYIWNLETGERSADAIDNVTLLRDYFINNAGELTVVSEDKDTQPAGHIATNLGGAADTVPQYVERPAAPSGLRVDYHPDTAIIAAYRTFFWSDPDTYITWPPANEANINSQSIFDIVRQKNTLLFAVGSLAVKSGVVAGPFTGSRGRDRAGIDLYVIYGALGGSATLRKVDSGVAPRRTPYGGYLFSAGGDTVYWVFDRWLASFDGSEVQVENAPLPRLIHDTDDYAYGPTAVVGFWGAESGKSQGELILAGSLGSNGGDEGAAPSASERRAVFNWKADGGGWTAHDPGIEYASQPVSNYLGMDQAGRGTSDFYVWLRGEDKVVFTTSGRTDATAETPKFYEMNLLDSFPDVESEDGDTDASVVADLYTADWWEEDGNEVQVRSVVVDYIYDTDADPDTQTFTLAVEALQTWEAGALRTSTPQVLTLPSEPTPLAQDGGGRYVRARKRFGVSDQGSGNGFRIHLSAWSGVLIKRMVVNATVSEPRD